jgi:CTP:molybdopterin cytidylyltransferase MocA
VLAGRPTFVRETPELDALIEGIAPPPHLFVFGSGHDALPVVQLAKSLGWSVTVVDPKGRFASRARFAVADRVVTADFDALRTAIDACARPLAVIMSHDYDADRDALGALLPTRAMYIGVLGPRRRTERMLAELARGAKALVPLSERDHARLHAPVGLALGSETPQEIALSIVAEAQAAVTGSTVASLRDRVTPIHDRPRVEEANAARWACAVLAAGGSRRLGRPKQLVPFRGRPLVRHVVEQACAAGCEEVAVVVGAHARPIADALEGLPVRLLVNRAWEEGVASSIRVATTWARDEGLDALAFALADQPGLSASHLDRLATAHREGAARVASAYGGAVGVPALFDARYFDRLMALHGDRGAARLLGEHDDRPAVAIPWPEGAIDVDTPSDLERLALLDVAE